MASTQAVVEEMNELTASMEKVLRVLAESDVRAGYRVLKDVSAYDLLVFEQGVLPIRLAALTCKLELRERPQEELDAAYDKIKADVERRTAYAEAGA